MIDFVQANGLTVTKTWPNRLVLDVEGCCFESRIRVFREDADVSASNRGSHILRAKH